MTAAGFRRTFAAMETAASETVWAGGHSFSWTRVSTNQKGVPPCRAQGVRFAGRRRSGRISPGCHPGGCLLSGSELRLLGVELRTRQRCRRLAAVPRGTRRALGAWRKRGCAGHGHRRLPGRLRSDRDPGVVGASRFPEKGPEQLGCSGRWAGGVFTSSHWLGYPTAARRVAKRWADRDGGRVSALVGRRPGVPGRGFNKVIWTPPHSSQRLCGPSRFNATSFRQVRQYQ